MKNILDSVLGAMSGKLLPWIIGIALVVAGTIVVISKNRDAKLVETGRESGAAAAVVEGQNTTLKQTENANEAGNQVRDDRGSARYDECLRSVAETHRSFCERYKRDQLVPG